jgi:hypothetical protein
VLFLACEDPNLLFQEWVMELNCELGLAGSTWWLQQDVHRIW